MDERDATLPDEAGQIVFREAVTLWVRPEVERRKAAGRWGANARVAKFQVLMWGAPHPRERATEIRLNDEVRAVAEVRVNAAKEAGEDVAWGEIDDVAGIATLEEGDDDDAAHITALRGGDGIWWLAFRFRYNRRLSREHIALALEYLDAAGLALSEGLPRPAAENCAAGMELIVKAERLQLPTRIKRRNPHSHLAQWYSRWAYHGNASADDAKLLGELNKLRKSVRYLEDGPTPTPEFMAAAIEQARRLADAVQQQVEIPWTAEVDAHLRGDAFTG